MGYLDERILVYYYKMSKENELECYSVLIHDYQYDAIVRESIWAKTIGLNHNRSFSCSSKEGIVYRSGVWLKEKDDKKAATLLSMYYEQEMEKLQSKMDKYIDILESLDSITQEEN